MSVTPDQRLHKAFRDRVEQGDLPPRLDGTVRAGDAFSPQTLLHVFESQLISRHMDLLARRLGREKRGFYSIGSSGHEGNAAFARALRPTDMAFLHYRSGAFLLERQRQQPGKTVIWDMALSLVAGAEDPVSGGRHKVIGDHELMVPPQTSTIASHLPKAVGTAFSIALARTHGRHDMVLPQDAVTITSFGDASANHSTAAGAINAAAHAGYRGLPLPLIFLCEDNGIGISVSSPPDWIRAAYGQRPGLDYIEADGTELIDALDAAHRAESIARRNRRPVFVRLKTVRLMGHAGSDQEASYRTPAQVDSAERQDPLLKSARTLIERNILSPTDILDLDQALFAQVSRVAEQACTRPKLDNAPAVMRSITPPKGAPARLVPTPQAREQAMQGEARTLATPQHMSRLLSLALADLMAADDRTLVFGEDVGRKGGVYGVTTKLQPKFGPSRVFDTLLDEQTILGLAIGMAQNGYLPLPEIQFLAYVHNAEDQIRGEAATLSFFSDGKATNPMVIRIAGLGYQRGFGGHFHNDNGIAVFRDIPGLIVACPSNGEDAVKLLRECYRLAKEEGRVVIFLEPIALYGQKDLYEEGDGALCAPYPDPAETLPFGLPGTEEDGTDLAILTYANGAYLSRRAIRQLRDTHNINARLVDIRWLKPLPIQQIIDAVGHAGRILVVDECRKTGSLSEELITGLVERGVHKPIARVNAADSFVPLGPAAYTVLPSEEDIVKAALKLVGRQMEVAAE